MWVKGSVTERLPYGRSSPAFMRVVLLTMAELIRARQVRMVQRER